MPAGLSSQFLKAPPKVDRTKPQRKSKPLDPSFLRDILEGIVDIPMGALGVGPDSKANRVGAMLGMALPLSKTDQLRRSILKSKSGKMSLNPTEAMDFKRLESGLPFDRSLSVPTDKLGRYPEVDIRNQIPTQNKLAMGVSPNSGIYDDAGRYLGPAAKTDPAFEAHVASSRNKHKLGMKIQSMEDSFVNKGDTSGISPTREMINELMKKFRK